MENAIEDLEEVFRLFDKGDCLLPGKIVMKWPGEHSEETIGRINAMPGYVGGSFNMSGIKWIGSGPNNPFKHNLPRASALIILNDPETMMPVAVMDGTVISAVRTGAVTGISAKYLAPKKAEVVGLFGAGVQNRTQLAAILESCPQIKKAYIFDISEERSRRFAEEMSEKTGIEIIVNQDRLDVISKSDILVTATTATEPIIHGAEIKKGCYVAHLGDNEVDEELIMNCNKIVIDDWETDKHRMGDTLAYMYRDGKIDDSKIYASLSDLICGRKKGRISEDELTYTCNVGLGIYDVAIAARVYRTAQKRGIGKKVELWKEPVLI